MKDFLQCKATVLQFLCNTNVFARSFYLKTLNSFPLDNLNTSRKSKCCCQNYAIRFE